MQKIMVSSWSLLLSFLLIATSVAAESKKLDFDADGIPDYVGFEKQNDGSANELAFRIVQTSDAQLVKKEFGKSEELAVLADYDGDGKTDFAVVGINPDGSLTLLWRIKFSSLNDELITSVFGGSSDLVISGCLFDADNKADKAVIQNSASLLFEKSSDSTTSGFTMDLVASEYYYCSDLNADGVDELIAAKLISSTQTAFVAWDVVTGLRVSENIVDGQATNVFAADIYGDGPKIGFEPQGKRRKLSFLVNGGIQTFPLAEFSKYTFGKFAAGSAVDGVYIKAKRSNSFKTYSSLTAAPLSFTIEDSDSLVPVVQVDTPGPAISKEAGCQVNNEAYDGPNKFLWKPVSDSTGKVAVHVPPEIRTKKAKIIKNGKVLENPSFGGRGNGNRALFRSRYNYGFFPNDVTVMLKSNGLTYCWLVEDPSQRVD